MGCSAETSPGGPSLPAWSRLCAVREGGPAGLVRARGQVCCRAVTQAPSWQPWGEPWGPSLSLDAGLLGGTLGLGPAAPCSSREELLFWWHATRWGGQSRNPAFLCPRLLRGGGACVARFSLGSQVWSEVCAFSSRVARSGPPLMQPWLSPGSLRAASVSLDPCTRPLSHPQGRAPSPMPPHHARAVAAADRGGRVPLGTFPFISA